MESNNSSQTYNPNGNDARFTNKMVLLLSGFIVIVIVLIIWIITTGGNKKISHSQVVKNIAPASVTITASGFVPSTLTIKVNQPIVWTNSDNGKHVVSTDPYPVDNGVAGFKSNILNTNDSYSFIMPKQGKYTYHDDLNPYKIKGEIIVK